MTRPSLALAGAVLALALVPRPAAAVGDGPILSDVPRYEEQAAAAGLVHVYGGPWEHFVGGGVAAFDCSQDGKPDLFVAGGKNPAALFVNRSPGGGARLKFEPRALDVDPKLLVGVTGAYPLDVDGDGFTDLAVMRVGENLILRGGPACRFEVANKALGFDGGRAWTTAFAATWEKGARFPTLAFGNYVDRAAPGAPFGTCHDNDLFRPEAGDRPRYGERTALSPGWCSLGLMFTDWNKSGTPALRVTNDRQYYRGGEEQLWRIEPGRPPRLYTPADGWRSVKIWGMGIASTDLNGDGYPDYALTSMGDTKLQVLDKEAEEDRPVYRDVAYEKGATAHRPYTGGDLKPSTGWHVDFQDVNNDTLADLFVVKGNVEAMPDFAAFDPDNLLLGGFDGRFHEAGDVAGLALPTKGRGGAVVDLDMDGMLDVVVVNREQPVSLFRNTGALRPDGTTGPMGNFLAVRLKNEGGNHWGVGARISVRIGTRTLTREVLVGGGHAGGQLGFSHFGLGVAERAEVRVLWPDGEWSHPYRVFANQFVLIDRAEKAAEYWYPAKE